MRPSLVFLLVLVVIGGVGVAMWRGVGPLPDGSVVKAAELSGRNGLLFRRNSVSGALEALPRDGNWGALNAELHANT